jgi:hypothetical protein
MRGQATQIEVTLGSGLLALGKIKKRRAGNIEYRTLNIESRREEHGRAGRAWYRAEFLLSGQGKSRKKV